jgi:hypothetical protein
VKPRLLYRDRDFDLEQALPRHAAALTQDLALDTVLDAMAGNDPFVLDVARKLVVSAVAGDGDAIRYRQAVLVDAMRAPAVVRELYGITVDALDAKRKHWHFGLSSSSPSSILSSSVELLQLSVEFLRKLRAIADAQRSRFVSEGFAALFAMLEAELSDAYFAEVDEHLRELRFRHGVLISAALGPGNAGTGFVLRRPRGKGDSWWQRMLGKAPPGLTYRLAERDQTGARALGELRDRGVNLVANAVAQSAEHVESFFALLRAELAFYVGCLNLYDRLAAIDSRSCIPQLLAAGSHAYHFTGLYDASLALGTRRPAVGNALAADRASLVMITGANKGGKSTLLRALGLAQLMMQAGMFVAAEAFTADVCTGVFTHFKREEDAAMNSGKLDEELRRMSGLADALAPGALVLFNESFASTNEREGSEIARQVVSALVERRIKVAFVTHLYDFARGMFERGLAGAVYLRAERGTDGDRTFKLTPGDPLQTSFGADLYRNVFGEVSPERAPRGDDPT